MENPAERRQITTKNWLGWVGLIILCLLVTLATWFPTFIERYYATGVYRFTSSFQRMLTGWIPFSLGDVLYLVLAVWVLWKFMATIAAIVRRRITRQKTVRRTLRLVRFLAWAYIVFNLAWGWNYHRTGIDDQLQLTTGKYSSSVIKQVLSEVVERLNENRKLLSADTALPEQSFPKMRDAAITSYHLAERHFPFLALQGVSVKKSMYSATAKYFGFTGYYNPFTGESQLSTRIPEVMKPFIICHEIGHQLGYAREHEASFVGYLAAASSEDAYFRYSVYLDLYASLRTKLVYTMFAEKDTAVMPVLQAFNNQLDTLVRFDRRKIREYFQRQRNVVSEQSSSLIMNMYGQYLRANQQAAGLQSYDDVVGLLIAYRRKYGRI